MLDSRLNICSVLEYYVRSFYAVRRMSNGHVNIKFAWGLSKSDPDQKPVLFVGQANHLSALQWDHVKCKLEPRVSEEVRP